MDHGLFYYYETPSSTILPLVILHNLKAELPFTVYYLLSFQLLNRKFHYPFLL